MWRQLQIPVDFYKKVQKDAANVMHGDFDLNRNKDKVIIYCSKGYYKGDTLQQIVRMNLMD